MCGFCENEEAIEVVEFEDGEYFSSRLKVFVRMNRLKISYDAYSVDSSFSCSGTIKYCPMCGDKLKTKQV
ncbi:hypothetical protein ACWN8V_06770 [Vagococcus elongatus]|uniref:Uncharacterized protein n=1 Tax=Vagococcus elongatus TaxID=180344 RepID=A0A430AW16_9ENTE|nr:hypothetical protein [Vagococcus elongatus]RSU12236.1 hypothetical protein CBF29_06460 [Vagococcus elongatus]